MTKMHASAESISFALTPENISRYALLRYPVAPFRTAVYLVAISLLGCLLSSGIAIAEDPPPLDLVRAAYLDAVGSVHSLDCRMHLKWERHTGQPQGENPLTDFEVHLVRDGRKTAREVVSKTAEGQSCWRDWAGYDGQQYAHFSEPLNSAVESGGHPNGIRGPDQLPQLHEKLTIDRLLGTTLCNGRISLEMLLSEPGARAASFELIEGSNCVRVEFGRHSKYGRPAGDVAEFIAWFDPQYKYLPRRILIRDVDSLANRTTSYQESTTFEFEAVPSSSGQQYFLPKSGVSKNQHTLYRLALESARVNVSVPQELFVPNFPQRTYVKVSTPNHPQRIVIIGGPDPHIEALKARALASVSSPDLAAGATPATATLDKYPSARPGDKTPWVYIVFRIGIALIVAVIGITIYRKFGQPV